MKSTLNHKDSMHVAVIMDGNGRWATRRGLPRSAGHQAGAHAVRRVIEAAPDLGVTSLTLFAFSSDNWRRPREEVSALRDVKRLAGAHVRMEGLAQAFRDVEVTVSRIVEVPRVDATGQYFVRQIALKL